MSLFWLNRCGSCLKEYTDVERCCWCYYKCFLEIEFHVMRTMKCFIFNYGLVLCCLQCKFRVIAEFLIAVFAAFVYLEECVLESKIIFIGMIFRISGLVKSKRYSFN